MTPDRRFMIAGLSALALAAPWRTGRAEPAPEKKRLLVLDFELIDTSNEPVDQREVHARRLNLVRDYVARGLAETRTYDVADRAPIESDLGAILKQTYIRTCNGCETTLAKKAGADLVLTGVVNKVSTLILSMGVSITRVSTGELLYHQGFDFRGDNDKSWERAAKFIVERIAREPPA